jgi:cytochrome oxidase Cu insertion factor (SCO1/SenC/PrrC family)
VRDFTVKAANTTSRVTKKYANKAYQGTKSFVRNTGNKIKSLWNKIF